MPKTESGEDLLKNMIPIEVLGKLTERSKLSTPNVWNAQAEQLQRRHEILEGVKLSPWQKALRNLWIAHLEVAHETRLLESDELRKNLGGFEDDGFRGALAECEAVWFFRNRLQALIHAKPGPADEKGVDFVASFGTTILHCEVKAPYVPRLCGYVTGEDSYALADPLKTAGKQFKRGDCNVVVFVPLLRTEVYSNRDQLIKAMIGERTVSVPVSLDFTPPLRPYYSFRQTGKVAKLWRKKGGLLEPMLFT